MIVNLAPAELLNYTEGVRVSGSPRSLEHDEGVEFDGASDGIVLGELGPVAGLTAFRVLARIRPSSTGAFEQRFFHIQAHGSDDRLLMEIRLLSSGEWYADTYFEYRAKSVLLQDPSRLHPSDAWATYELAYDGCTLRHTIDGSDHLVGIAGRCPATRVWCDLTRSSCDDGTPLRRRDWIC